MKEAVVYIVDSSPSMNLPYPTGTTTTTSSSEQKQQQDDSNKKSDDDDDDDDDSRNKPSTRLEAAKQALQSMIAELMIQSVTNEVSVIVCKTTETQHHMIASGTDMEMEDPDTVPYPNLTELTNGVTRPTVQLLRQIGTIKSSTTTPVDQLRGDVCDALVVAADALYQRTTNAQGKLLKFARKIVILTDAEHEFLLDAAVYLQILDKLREMDCHVQVIGLDFDREFESYFAEKAPAPDSNKRIKIEDEANAEEAPQGSPEGVKQEDTDAEDVDEDDETDDEDEGDPNLIQLRTKRDRERFLQDMTQKTGGQVVAALTLQQILDVNKGKRVTASTRSKMELRIGPGLSLEARFMLLMKEEGYPRLEMEAVLIDDSTGKPMLDEEGKEMTEKINKVYQYVDEEHPEDIVDENDRTTAIRFGSDLVPLGYTDLEGLKDAPATSPWIQILGYVSRDQVPRIYLSGPPYAISGGDSQKSCAAVSALARALFRLKKVAICTFLKSKKSSGPILGALFPLEEPECKEPIHLAFLQLPFAGDVKQLTLANFEEILKKDSSDENEQKAKACDDLIDALMLPDDLSGKVPSPFLRSWNQTKLNRAIDPEAPLVLVRETAKDDPMVTPPDILAKAGPALERYTECFPLQVQKTVTSKKGGNKGRVAPNYKDFLEGE